MEFLIQAVNMFFSVATMMLFLRVVFSWFPVGNNRLMELLLFLTDPIIVPIRNIVRRSPLGGPGMIIDFSVLIAFVLLRVVQGLIVSALIRLGNFFG